MSEPSPSDRPLLDKLGVKPGARISMVGMRDQWFVAELATRTGDVHDGSPRADSDLILVYVQDRADLDQALSGLEDSLKRNGAIWVIRPKGTQTSRRRT